MKEKKSIQREKAIKYCPICKEKQCYESSIYTLNWVCVNIKCKAYLLRELPIQVGPMGGIRVYDEIRK